MMTACVTLVGLSRLSEVTCLIFIAVDFGQGELVHVVLGEGTVFKQKGQRSVGRMGVPTVVYSG